MTVCPPDLVDIGVNLTHPSLAREAEAVVARAQAAGVRQLLITGTSLDESEQALELGQRLDPQEECLFTTAGVHPHDARHWEAGSANRLRVLLGESRCRAVGECGLDFNRDFSPRPQQEAAFAAQLELAATLGLPVFLHERDADQRLLAILREYRDHLPGAVLHCFTGERQALFAYLDLDLYIGITGWICDERRGGHLHALVGNIPEQRLLLETDAPYLLPRTLRPRPKSGHNEPAYLPWVLEEVARHRQIEPALLARQTSTNARRLFNLPERSEKSPES